jgi:5'(3')-deoxyribonucleotidase
MKHKKGVSKMKKVVYIDMDNVLVDFPSGIECLREDVKLEYKDRLDDVPGIFALMAPMDGAIAAFNRLAEVFDVYILSTAPWKNPSAWSDKLLWVQKHLGEVAKKKLILTHHKDLNVGDYLIDDRTKNGVDKFKGEHIHFGSEQFPNWQTVEKYLLSKLS